MIAAEITIPNIINNINRGEKCTFNFEISPAYIKNYSLSNSTIIQSFNDNLKATYLYNIDGTIWNNIKRIEIL
jgi:hypothetical protein